MPPFSPDRPPKNRADEHGADAPWASTAKARLAAIVVGLVAAAGVIACSAEAPVEHEPLPHVEQPPPPPSEHWSFEQGVVSEPPALETLSDPTWVVNGIDAFVMAGLDGQG